MSIISKDKVISAENTFTDDVAYTEGDRQSLRGGFDLTNSLVTVRITGTYVGQITLITDVQIQNLPGGPPSTQTLDFHKFPSAFVGEQSFVFSLNRTARAGFKTSEYTSGDATVYIEIGGE